RVVACALVSPCSYSIIAGHGQAASKKWPFRIADAKRLVLLPVISSHQVLTRDEAFLVAVNIAKLPSVPRQILKDIPRPPNSASRDDGSSRSFSRSTSPNFRASRGRY